MLTGQWLPETVAEYKQFLDGNASVKDPVERALMDMADSLLRSWKANRCQACSTAENAALAAATLTLYREGKR